MNHFIKKYSAEIKGSLICLSLGMLAGYSASNSSSDWYKNLIKPSFNPPDWVFPLVWSILYVMMGIVLGQIWSNKLQPRRSLLLSIFTVQFFYNLSWSPLFFYLHRIDLALYDIFLLETSIIMFIISARHQRTIILLFLLYLLWVSYALVLNFTIYQLNV